MADLLTPDELRTLLAVVVAGVVGGMIENWRDKIGSVTKLPIHSNTDCNWMIDPIGHDEDLATIAAAACAVRKAHPYVTG